MKNKYVSTFIMVFLMTKASFSLYPLLSLAIILLQLVQGLEPVASANINKIIFDNLSLGKNNDYFQIGYLIIILLLISIVYRFTNSISTLLSSDLFRRISLNSKISFLSKLNDFKGIRYFESSAYNNMISLGSQGALMGPTQIQTLVINLVKQIVIVFSFIYSTISINYLLAIILITVSVPSLIFKIRQGSQRINAARSISPNQRRAFYLENLLSQSEFAKELRLLNSARYLLDKLEDCYNKIHSIQKIQETMEIKTEIILSTIADIVANAFFFIIVLQAINGVISYGDILFYMIAIKNIQSTIQGIFGTISTINENLLYYKEYDRLMALPQPLSISDNKRPICELKYGIEFKDISFRYKDEYPWILKHCNLFVPKGKSVGLVGINGAGKSTLVKLLLRFYDPDNGQILWDGIDIREFDIDLLRRHISATLQDFVRYELSVSENIGIGEVEYINDSERIYKAAKIAGADKFIEQLPDKYNTTISMSFSSQNDGIDISGGQWQKLANARMFMRNSDIFVLDEPTSSLDIKAEQELYDRLNLLFENHTCLMISHRLTTIRSVDLIAVLDNGAIVEYGTHEELINKKGKYFEIFDIQAKKFINSHNYLKY